MAVSEPASSNPPDATIDALASDDASAPEGAGLTAPLADKDALAIAEANAPTFTTLPDAAMLTWLSAEENAPVAFVAVGAAETIAD